MNKTSNKRYYINPSLQFCFFATEDVVTASLVDADKQDEGFYDNNHSTVGWW